MKLPKSVRISNEKIIIMEHGRMDRFLVIDGWFYTREIILPIHDLDCKQSETVLENLRRGFEANIRQIP